MKQLNQLIQKIITNKICVAIVVTLVVWIFVFRNFFTDQYTFLDDAISYYEHTKYYIDNIMRGQYPLWDPNWNCGIPNNFFLRRMGEYNPFYSVIILLRYLGLEYRYAYLIFLALYYFLGMIGFYKLAKHLFQNSFVAFISYLLMMFSSFVLLLFNSFIILIFTPMAWFFFFLLSFSERPQRHTFLGAIYMVMLLVITYIPFYFFIIVAFFVLYFLLLFFSSLKSIFSRYGAFIRDNKVFVGICVLLLLLSLIPGGIFYAQSKADDFVLPGRSYLTEADHPLGVAKQSLTVGGIAIHVIWERLFSKLSQFQIGVFYIPVFAFVLFLLGFITRARRKLILLYLLGLTFFLMGLYDATPIYEFLYRHIFFFKYFRNFHFFIWLVLLPVFVLIASQHLSAFIQIPVQTTIRKRIMSVFIIVIHVALGIFLWTRESVIPSTYGVCMLSLIFFLLYIHGKMAIHKIFSLAIVSFIIILQPLEVYHYLNLNARKQGTDKYRYRYEPSYFDFTFENPVYGALISEKQIAAYDNAQAVLPKIPYVYFGSAGYNTLKKTIPEYVVQKYLYYRFYLYENVEYVAEADIDFGKIEKIFRKNLNTAIVLSEDKNQKQLSLSDHPHANAQPILENSEEFEILSYDMNHITFKTHYEQPKYLVYNDSYHRFWKLLINGKKKEIDRAQYAFKGIFLPQGKNVVSLSFGKTWQYVLGYSYIVLFCLVLGYLIFIWIQSIRQIPGASRKWDTHG